MFQERVLLLVSQIYGNGGIPRFNRNLINALNESDCELIVLSMQDSVSSTESIHCAGGNKIKFICKYVQLSVNIRPTKVIIGLLNFAPISILKTFIRFKVVVILHGVEGWYKRKKLIPFYRFVDRFWAVSDYTKFKFSISNNIQKKRISRIFNTLQEDWCLDDAAISYGKYFLSVTRLDVCEGYKGVDLTILAVAKLGDWLRKRGWKYKIVAKGTALEWHKKLAVEQGVSDIVEFMENVDDVFLKTLYQDCSFFILPSTGEGFGIVFLEAMVHSKPCIGCKNCGTEDVIEHGKTGFLIDQDIHQIESTILELIGDDELLRKIGKSGRERFFERFSFVEFKKKIYLELCAV